MANIKILIKRINGYHSAMATGMEFHLDEIESTPKCIRVYVDDNGFSTLYTFDSANDLRDWAYNVA